MAISKEAKTGAIVLTAIVVFFLGFFFLKGSDLFSSDNTYYGYYDNVQGLQPSAQIMLQGVIIGQVKSIKLAGKDKVQVEMSITDDIKIPKSSIASITSFDLLGSKGIKLNMGTGSDFIEDGGTIETSIENGVVDNISTQINPILANVNNVILGLDTVMSGIKEILNLETQARLKSSITNLEHTMNNFSNIASRLNQESDDMVAIVRNANSFMNNLSDNNKNIGDILDNAKTITDNLAASPIEQTVAKLNNAAGELDTLLTKINKGEGTIGAAFNDKRLYEELTNTLNNMKTLMADIEAHPSRYINVTIFGRRQKEAK